MRVPIGIKPGVEWRFVVEFPGNIGPVDTCPVCIKLRFAAMPAQFDVPHMIVRIEQPTGDKQAAPFDTKHMVDAHAYREWQAGDRLGSIEAIGGRTHTQENVGQSCAREANGSHMAGRLTRT